MQGPYAALIRNGEKVIDYRGNKIFPRARAINTAVFIESTLNTRFADIVNDKRFYHLHKIDSAIFIAAVDFFSKFHAEWCNLPLTTRMISSPGEVYAGKKLDYTTDAGNDYPSENKKR